MITIQPESLGCADFRRRYGVRCAYLAGAMYKGIASKELVVAMGRAGQMGFFGSGGLALPEIESAIRFIRQELGEGKRFGVNLLSNMQAPEVEHRTASLLMQYDVSNIEAAAFVAVTPSIVHLRLSGLRVNSRGDIEAPRSIMAKISRPEVASAFLQPPPAHIVKDLVARGLVTEAEARLGERLPTATELCVEADSGGHTDQGVAFALLPAMLALRDDAVRKYGYQDSIAVGAAGGIGTPQAAAAAFVMGADFVLTGSINQCTVESGASGAVKDILQTLSVQDTAYAPAGDMFELGAKVQVARRGLFFPARANKLFDLYQRHSSLDEIDATTRRQIEEKYFKRSFDAVWRETVEHYGRSNPKLLEEAEQNPRRKMALIFKWYFVHSTRLALAGSEDQKVDYQIHCGPALGSFNAWVKGTEIEPWHQRRVGDIAQRILSAAADSLQRRVNTWMTRDAPRAHSGGLGTEALTP